MWLVAKERRGGGEEIGSRKGKRGRALSRLPDVTFLPQVSYGGLVQFSAESLRKKEG